MGCLGTSLGTSLVAWGWGASSRDCKVKWCFFFFFDRVGRIPVAKNVQGNGCGDRMTRRCGRIDVHLSGAESGGEVWCFYSLQHHEFILNN